jgi:glycosyltransferase involved in cell wall biosynthesis
MNIWVIKTGEPIPAATQKERLRRMGTLTGQLLARGHEVVWWTSTVDHIRKELIFEDEKVVKVNDQYKIHYLKGPLYKKNVSVMRLVNHRIVAKEFLKACSAEKRPDIMVCGYPTIDLADAVLKYGKKHSIPVFLDIADLWPDVLLTALPSSFSPLGKLLLAPYYRMAKRCLRNADYLIAVSEGYLQWAYKFSGRPVHAEDACFPLGYYQTIHHAAKEEALKALAAKYAIDQNKTIVWYLGSFGQSYDLETVIRAAKRMQEQGNDKIQFIISGDGDNSSKYKKLAKGLKNMVFTGWLDKPEIDGIMQLADIGLMAYTKEAKQGLPYKIFEYMSAGLPILSSLQSETKEILKENAIGLTYQPEDSDSFMKQLLLLSGR